MYVADTMGLAESLTVSVLGFLIVVMALSFLAIATTIFSKNLALLGVGAEENVKVKNLKPSNDVDEESMAVIISAIAEEVQMPLEKFKIKSIKKID